ncbi:APC family permease [Streptococcus cuniculipharyngis]|uniref:Amino acid permease n=1 Tax=Streptococcus cuniculipharyngis TaxID=1562651 RepID=A0A5C5SCK5_9STRE|nr:amino acid permease [Streptococcus cuniculipharyngis]TWS97721.1 amino acid permease [Streptococcus cuniculipharyngis]
MSMFRTKSTDVRPTELKRHLNLGSLILLGIGTMVGTGIFTRSGAAIATAGPALMISILIAAVAVGLSALIYAEFASRIPRGGGAYSYIYATLGEFPAWMAAWFVGLEFLTAVAGVSSGWASYLKGLLAEIGIQLPLALSGVNPAEGQYVDVMALLVVVLVTGLVLLDSQKSLRFNNFLVILKFSALALFLMIGVFYVKPANWSNFAPFGFGQLVGGQTGIMAGAATMFYAFLGFEAMPMAIDETKNHQKTMPKAIAIAVGSVAVLYALVTLVLSGLVNYTELNVGDAVAFALRQVGLGWAANYVATVAILTLITVCISLLFALARLTFTLSQDGLLPKSFSNVSEKSKVPVNATILAGIISALMAGFFPLNTLANLTSLVTLMCMAMLPIGLMKLRRETGAPQAGQFTVPAAPLVSVLSFVICLFMIGQMDADTWKVFTVTIIIGILIYFFYGYKHSSLTKK